MALPLTLPGFTDPAAGARRTLAAQVERLNQWDGGCNGWSLNGGGHEDPHGGVVETVRSILEWASSMEGSAELAPACRAVRDKLAMRDVVSVVQEFIGSLLYVALAAENAQGKHAGDETGQLADFLYQLCGLREQAEQSSSSGAHVRAALVEPCKSCACCHIAIQESMNLLRFVHNFATCSSGAATSETPCFEQRLPRHMEDGLLLLLDVVVKLSSNLHEDCFLVAERFDHLKWWPQYEQLRRDCPVASWPLSLWALFQKAWLDMEQAVVKLQKRVALLRMQTARMGRRGRQRATRPSAGFVMFPPSLPKVELSG